MKKPTLIIAATLASATLGVGATIAVAGDKKSEEKIEKVGEPINCINARQIRSTNVVDNKTIDFRMPGGKTYRNTLPNSCPGLKNNDAFSYKSSVNRLCNVDIIRVLESFGGQLREGAGCGLGKFQEIKKIKAGKKTS